MFDKPWSLAADARHTRPAVRERRNWAKRVWAVAFSLILALSGPVGSVGAAHIAWAEQETSQAVAAEQQAAATPDPQAEDTGSLDPPQTGAGTESAAGQTETAGNAAGASQEGVATSQDGGATNGPAGAVEETSGEGGATAPAASVTLGDSEQGWAHVAIAGAVPGDALHIDAMGRADAIWCDLLLEAFPQAQVEDLGNNEVELHLDAAENAEWELPGVMADLVASVALVDSDGNAKAFAEGPALYATNLIAPGDETFTAYNEHIVDGNCPKIRNAQTGKIAWCADSRRAAPGTNTETGDWPEASYAQASAWDVTTVSGVNLGSVLPQLEYIMAHADAASDEGIYIAQQAIWTLTNPDRIPYGSYSYYNGQICALVDAANAYAESGAGHYSGSCQVYVPATGDGYLDRWMQYVVVSGWNPLSNLTVSKEAGYDSANGTWTGLPKQVTWRLVSTDGTAEGAVYDRTETSNEGSSCVTFSDTPRETQYRLYEVEAPSGYQPREVIGLFCNPDGSWSVWNAQEGDWNSSTWATGQAGSTVYTGISNEAGSSVLHVQDAPSAGSIELVKVSSEPAVTDGNDCYSLAGAEYGVYSDQSLTSLVDTLMTDGAGHAASKALDPGTYWVSETKPSKGYALDENAYRVEVEAGKVSRVNGANGGTVSEEPQGDPQAVVVRKVDALSGQATPQGDMSLAGAQITVEYYKGFLTEDDLAKDDAPAPERTWVLETDEDGVAALIESCKVGGDDFYTLGGRPYLPLGTTVVRETKAPQGYEANSQTYVCHFASDESGRKWISFDMTATIPQTQLAGGLALRKVDAESSETTPRGAASLDGARFGIYNASQQAVTVQGTVFEPVALEQVQSGDAQPIMEMEARGGIATTDSDGDGLDASLPFGTYYVRETVPGEGYLLDDQVHTVGVHEAGKVSWCDAAYENQAVRGDLAFNKVHEDTKGAMARVAFLIESTTTHERHVVVTDEAGRIDTSSSTHPHSANSNANDAAYDPATGAVDESLLDPGAGVWFYGDAGITGAVDDALGALPYDTYTLTELATSASQGTWLTSFEVTVHDNATTVDLGNVEDVWIPVLSTELTCWDGTHEAFALTEQMLTDTVSYRHFSWGTYTAVLELCDESGSVLTDGQGQILRASSQVELGGDGTYSLSIVGDLSSLAGKRIVARHSVYDSAGNLYASHDDMMSEAQSVDVTDTPHIATSLTEAGSGLHMAQASEGVRLTDTVSYSGLIPGRTYALSGTLMDKASGAQVMDASGEPVRANAEFTPSQASGTQTVTFEFDSSSLAGKTLVAFETLSYRDHVLGVHADIGDAEQTVTFPEVRTVLATAEGGHSVMGDGPIDLVDTVSYANLLPQATYRIVGSLHDAKTGEAYRDAAGKPFEAQSEFEAQENSGTVEVTFKSVAGIQAGQAVAFEELYVHLDGKDGEDAWKLVGAHCDLADAQQTVSFNTPSLRTVLTDKQTSLHETSLAEQTTLVDRVNYEGLEPGKTYRIDGKLVDKQTGRVIRDAKGKTLTASGEFKATSAKGAVDVTFTFDATRLAGKEVVAFESLSFEGREVAVHANLNDAAQTVSFVDIRTTAADPADGDHEAAAMTDMKLLDKVEMRGLAAGQPYTLVTELVVADTHETVVASSTRFIPTKSSTTLDVTATFDGSSLAGKQLVFLETLQRDGKTVAQHRDYSDAGQTVSLVTPPPLTPGEDMPQTGQGLVWAALIGAGLACIVAGTLLARKRVAHAPSAVKAQAADTARPEGPTPRADAPDNAGNADVPRIRPRQTARGRGGRRNDG